MDTERESFVSMYSGFSPRESPAHPTVSMHPDGTYACVEVRQATMYLTPDDARHVAERLLELAAEPQQVAA